MMGWAIARTIRSGTSVGPGSAGTAVRTAATWSESSTRDTVSPAMTRDEIRPRAATRPRSLPAQSRADGGARPPHRQGDPSSRQPQVPGDRAAPDSAGALGVACAKLGEAEVMAAAGIRGLLITTEIVRHRPSRGSCGSWRGARHDDRRRQRSEPRRRRPGGRVGRRVRQRPRRRGHRNRRTGAQPGEPALALARDVARQRSLRLRGLQGYAGHCAHIIGWKARRDASLATMAGLMETRQLLERDGLPVEVVAGASTGTYDIDVELPGLTELQSGSYCVMDLEYRKIGGRDGDALNDFDMR